MATTDNTSHVNISDAVITELIAIEDARFLAAVNRNAQMPEDRFYKKEIKPLIIDKTVTVD